jgi:biopolymer transport protein TolR
MPLDSKDEPLIVSVDATGQLFLKEGQKNEPVDEVTLTARVTAFVGANPKLPVLIGGDQQVGYGRVYEVMALLQQAGVPRVGLMGEPYGKTPVPTAAPK